MVLLSTGVPNIVRVLCSDGADANDIENTNGFNCFISHSHSTTFNKKKYPGLIIPRIRMKIGL